MAEASAKKVTQRKPRTAWLISIVSVFSILFLSACGSGASDADNQAQSDVSSERDISQEEENREIVEDFYNGFFNDHNIAAADVIADDYIQHNPQVPDGKAPFVEYFTQYFQDFPDANNRIVRSATNDDLVYLHVHSVAEPEDLGQAIVDIFRVSDGQIVEHWDVIQDVPETSANENTMF